MNVYSSYEELSRPVRSSLIYLTLISSLAVTLYFGSVIIKFSFRSYRSLEP